MAREQQSDAHALGWDVKARHSWSDMLTSVNNHIRGLNSGQAASLRSAKVQYYNKFATFADPHTIELDDGNGEKERVTAKFIVIACGGRPSLGSYPGVEECCISSDDIFWMQKPPGKTLCIGASYIALECAGFLAGLGFDTTVMVRSILLRGFDREIADKIGSYMEGHGVSFARGMVPSGFEKTESGQVRVFVEGAEWGVFDTVLMAVGRTGCAGWLNLEAAGLPYDAKNGKVVCDEAEQTSVPHIYAIGDVIVGRPELTPVAIQCGRRLVRRLFGGKTKLMDYRDVATTVFTPIEYGSVGLSEEEAKEKLGDNLVIYHAAAVPLEWKCNHHRKEGGFFKVLCDKGESEKVVGMHVLGPNAGEVIQGFSVAMQAGMTKENLDDCVGIHPTFAESLTTMKDVKGDSGEGPAVQGC